MCYFYIRKKFHIHRRNIYNEPVTNGNNVDLCNIATIDGEIVKVHVQRNNKFIHIAK